jgi:hypothetical protein
MRLAEVGQDDQQGGPHPDEKGENKEQNLPFRNVCVPEEAPIAPIELYQVNQDLQVLNHKVHRTPLNQ